MPEPRIQYATTSDGVNIAFTTVGDGIPLVQIPAAFSHLQLEWQLPGFQTLYGRPMKGLGHLKVAPTSHA